MISYRLYKFCQEWWITIACAAFALFYLLYFNIGLSLVLSIVISAAGVCVLMLPGIGIFYPLTFLIIMIIGVIGTSDFYNVRFYTLCAITLLHIIRMAIMFVFNKKHPDIAAEYDREIRSGI